MAAGHRYGYTDRDTTGMRMGFLLYPESRYFSSRYILGVVDGSRSWVRTADMQGFAGPPSRVFNGRDSAVGGSAGEVIRSIDSLSRVAARRNVNGALQHSSPHCF